MRTFVFTFFFWSLSAVAAEAPIERLLPISKEFYIPKNVEEIKDLPRVTSQDNIGICFSNVAATMMQLENCRYVNKNQQDPAKKIKCSELGPDQLFSPLDLARMQTEDGVAGTAARADYKSLYFKGGSLMDAIRFGGLMVKQTASQACASLDTVLSKMNTRPSVKDAQAAMWERLETEFKNVKEMEKGKLDCDKCLDNIYATARNNLSSTIQNDLNLSTDPVKQAKAFAAKTYGEFLSQFLGTAHCVRPSQMVTFDAADSVDYVGFPKGKGQKTTPAEVTSKIIDVLKGGRPVALNSICYAATKPEKCPSHEYHAVVVAGYRNICNDQGKCRESFKVINSLGKSWQDQNDDGWIDAKTVLENTDMGPGVISWFVDKA